MTGPKIRLSEVFGPTLQGEGPDSGVPVYFLRLGGCDFRCVWCDTKYAVTPALVRALPGYEAIELAKEVHEKVPSGSRIVISGGNPLIYDLRPFLDRLWELGEYHISIETQGSVYKSWVRHVDQVIVSPKPPSAEVEFDFNTYVKVFKAIAEETEAYLKIVVFDEADIKFARMMAEATEAKELYLSVGTTSGGKTSEILTAYRLLIPKVFSMMEGATFKWRFTPQLHVLLWGQERGV